MTYKEASKKLKELREHLSAQCWSLERLSAQCQSLEAGIYLALDFAINLLEDESEAVILPLSEEYQESTEKSQEMQDLRLELHEQKLRLKDLKSELDMKVLNINTRIQEIQADAQVVFEKMDRIERLNIDATKIKKLEENVRTLENTQNDILNYLSDQAEKKGEGNA